MCKEFVCIYNRLWINAMKNGKTLRLNVLAPNALILNSFPYPAKQANKNTDQRHSRIERLSALGFATHR